LRRRAAAFSPAKGEKGAAVLRSWGFLVLEQASGARMLSVWSRATHGRRRLPATSTGGGRTSAKRRERAGLRGRTLGGRGSSRRLYQALGGLLADGEALPRRIDGGGGARVRPALQRFVGWRRLGFWVERGAKGEQRRTYRPEARGLGMRATREHGVARRWVGLGCSRGRRVGRDDGRAPGVSRRERGEGGRGWAAGGPNWPARKEERVVGCLGLAGQAETR
jgi:hypothetical protein